jgi:aryl-alcohol dehydrogenase-like predicted oxidoreductase
MKKHQLGRTDLTVSRACLGTMTFGEQNTEADGGSRGGMRCWRAPTD